MTRHATPWSRRDCLRQLLMRLPLLGVVPAIGLGAGCSLRTGPRVDFQVLRDAGAKAGETAGTPATGAPRIDKVLLLAASALPGLYDGDHMVFSADGRSRSYFQFGYWSERPAQSLLVLAEARFTRAQAFRQVALSTAGVRGDLLLTLRLEELYLDASVDPGQLKLVLSAELVDWQQRKLLARRGFSHVAPAVTRDAGGVAVAASAAVGVVLGDLVDWAIAVAATSAPPAA